MNFSKLISFLNVNREGILIGAAVGFLVGKFILPDYIDMSMVAQTAGIVDVLQQGATNAVELAKTKIVWASTIFGAGVGLLIDMNLKERKWF